MNCNKCGFPIIPGAAGYAGSVCMCQWQAVNHSHNSQDSNEVTSHALLTVPADYTFASVNTYVHDTERHFEELQYLALGMASEIEKLRKGEFICRRCGIRKNSESNAKADF